MKTRQINHNFNPKNNIFLNLEEEEEKSKSPHTSALFARISVTSTLYLSAMESLCVSVKKIPILVIFQSEKQKSVQYLTSFRKPRMENG